MFNMILKETLLKIVRMQRDTLKQEDTGIIRDILSDIKIGPHYATILSGIRRCGKSTLLKQLMKNKNVYYFNFEDQNVFGFDVADFERLDEVFHEEFGESKYYFFDEIQNVEGWERFVRKQQDAGKIFVITGSNASLLSKELGTKLTGRHINYELFPFSYQEMLKFTLQKQSLKSFSDYSKRGGFPLFLKYKKNDILQELLTDIVARDIIVRYKLREDKIIKQLLIYLMTNVGKEFSYNKIKNMFNLGSVNTISAYISYFEDSYLIFTIPKFDYSYKKQLVSPKKVYSIDVGFSNANSIKFSGDKGRVFENLVFLDLRRKYKEIFYFRDVKECDFVIKEKDKLILAVQVCYDLNEDNKERELAGLKEAMKKLNIKTGIILTLNQEDELENIKIMPAWKYFSVH